MSIQDFARNLQLTMADLDKAKPDQITNVVMKNLQPLSITDRPFHCTDLSGSEWYVNDKDMKSVSKTPNFSKNKNEKTWSNRKATTTDKTQSFELVFGFCYETS